jgi:ActR/RegA family two-component response regulator
MTPSIVIVEDEAIVAKDLRRSLERAGFLVLYVATTGEAAAVTRD